MGILPRVSFLVVLAAGGSVFGAHAKGRYLPDGALPGLRIDGAPVVGSLQTTLDARVAALRGRKVHLTSSSGDDSSASTRSATSA